MRDAYHAPEALNMEPTVRNRIIVSSISEMRERRRVDGIWECDEPFSNDEVEIFRVFTLWKRGNWDQLGIPRPTAAVYPPIGVDARILPIDHHVIMAGGADANYFQPQLPPPPKDSKKKPKQSKKPTDDQPKKKPPSDPKDPK